MFSEEGESCDTTEFKESVEEVMRNEELHELPSPTEPRPLR